MCKVMEMAQQESSTFQDFVGRSNTEEPRINFEQCS